MIPPLPSPEKHVPKHTDARNLWGEGGALVGYDFCCQEIATSHLQKPKELLSRRCAISTCGPHASLRVAIRRTICYHRRSQDGDSFCFKSWPENLEPSSAARTQIFRGNLSLPDSGWPRFVCMFDLSSAQGFLAVAPRVNRNLGFLPL